MLKIADNTITMIENCFKPIPPNLLYCLYSIIFTDKKSQKKEEIFLFLLSKNVIKCNEDKQCKQQEEHDVIDCIFNLTV